MSEPESGRVALVTGANRGLGYEICRQLAGRGLRVISTSRDEEKGRAAVASLASEGLDLAYRQLDVSDPESVAAASDWVAKEFGRLDVLVNNAGILLDLRHSNDISDTQSILEVEEEVMEKTLQTNTRGPLRVSQAFVPQMTEGGYGRIVNVSSGLGQLSGMGTGWPAYRISKTAVNAITRILAAEMEGSNIKINSASPGWVRTDMGGADAERSPAEGADTIVWLATLPDDGPSGGFFEDRKPVPW